jgi:hypothetical protein
MGVSTDSTSSILGQCESDPDQVPDSDPDICELKNFTVEKQIHIFSFITTGYRTGTGRKYLSLCLHEARKSYKRSPCPQTRTLRNPKTLGTYISNLFIFFVTFLAIWIRIQRTKINADPETQQW